MAWAYQSKEASLFALVKFLSGLSGVERVFHCDGSFGDVYIQIACISESLDKLPPKSTVVLIDSRYEKLASNALTNRAKVILINTPNFRHILDSVSPLGKSSYFPTRLLPTLYPLIPDLMMAGLLNYVTFFRFMVDSSRVGPMQPIESVQNADFEMVWRPSIIKRKTVLLVIEQNTHPALPFEFWCHVIREIKRRNFMPLLVVTKKDGSTYKRLIQWDPSLVSLNVPPEHIVTLTRLAGYYIGGSVGFLTIQSFFNSESRGIHVINLSNQDTEGFIMDNSNNKIRPEILSWRNQFPDEFIGNQEEFRLTDPIDFDYLNALITKMLNC